MKKLNYLFISLLFMLSFTSCEKDEGDTENNTSATEAQIEGNWELVSYVVEDGKSSVSVQGFTSSTKFTQKGHSFNYNVQYRTNPNTATAEGDFKVDVKTTTLGQTSSETILLDASDAPASMGENSWELINNGTQLKSTANGISTISNILEISDSTFKYATDLSQTVIPGLENLNDSPIQIDGLDFSVSGSLVTTLRKVSTSLDNEITVE